MRKIRMQLLWTFRAKTVFVVLSLLLLGEAGIVQAQNEIEVPEDYPTIQAAIDAANPGDEIEVGRGNWCGAVIDKPLKLEGDDGATIIACPSNFGSPDFKIGFRILATGSGTSIEDFVFDGRGYSDTNTAPLGQGISSQLGTNDVELTGNRFLGGVGGMSVNGSGWVVSENVFSGFTILSSCLGGFAIVSEARPGRFTDNTFTSNTITAKVPEGDFSPCSWITSANVPFAGIIVTGQDGAFIENNKISIVSNSGGDAGAGIIATDVTADAFPPLTDINLVIKKNDGRKSKYALIIPLDESGGTGNTVGARIRDNLGLNVINGVTKKVK